VNRHVEAQLEWLQQRHEAQQVQCPECDAPAGEVCVSVAARDEGRELERLPCHWKRIRAAEQQPKEKK